MPSGVPAARKVMRERRVPETPLGRAMGFAGGSCSKRLMKDTNHPVFSEDLAAALTCFEVTRAPTYHSKCRLPML